MRPLVMLLQRAMPALLMAASVVLLSAGIFSYALPTSDAGAATYEPGDPNFQATPDPNGTAGPEPTSVGMPPPTAGPDASPGASPAASPSPEPGASVAPSASPDASATQNPGATPNPNATPDPNATPTSQPGSSPGAPTPRPDGSPGTIGVGNGVATRIVVPAMNIDLPVVAGNLVVPGNRDFYPLCDVAQYLVDFARPGHRGTSYLYAHARSGMFLPLLTASQRNNGRGMIGNLVEVYTSDNRLHLYEIYRVKRHATDLSLAYDLPPGGHQLIMQTSEGPRGHVPKLQVAARPIGVVAASRADANPPARPRVCR